ncbi:outer membrane beta-barrel protein [Arcicella aurantiaca]|uniref:Outer membrane beta-barrel protein n=1 Tax=Arcicella aurantiaca TaxID=591202 RepID=A0A316DU60_9BACT|nr:TonB-dependent receptor [Arcicella aurantiaca]PWK21611.1 outer membrane beta-barrel protein [Arcicella aurantiaca]
MTSYFNANLVLKSGSFKVYNLDYTHRFKNSSSITFSFLHENALIDGYTKNQNLNALNYQDTLQYTLNTGANPLNASRIKFDYEKKMWIGKFSLGYQYRTQQQNGVFTYYEKQGNFTNLAFNPAFSAEISVLNRIHGIYTQYAGSFKNLEFSTGLRFENAFREFKVAGSNSSSVLTLSNFFPSANILYNLSNNLRAKIAFSRRVQRSTNNELNPYPEREHSETLEQGDPNIKPEFINVYETGITKDFKKASLYWNVYVQQITDIVNRVNSVYNEPFLTEFIPMQEMLVWLEQTWALRFLQVRNSKFLLVVMFII